MKAGTKIIIGTILTLGIGGLVYLKLRKSKTPKPNTETEEEVIQYTSAKDDPANWLYFGNTGQPKYQLYYKSKVITPDISADMFLDSPPIIPTGNRVGNKLHTPIGEFKYVFNNVMVGWVKHLEFTVDV